MDEGGGRDNPDADHAPGDTGMKAVFPILLRRAQVLPGRRNRPGGGVSAAHEKPPHHRRAGEFRTIWAVRGLLLLQIAIYLALVSIHFGMSIGGYRHPAAGTTESV